MFARDRAVQLGAGHPAIAVQSASLAADHSALAVEEDSIGASRWRAEDVNFAMGVAPHDAIVGDVTEIDVAVRMPCRT